MKPPHTSCVFVPLEPVVLDFEKVQVERLLLGIVEELLDTP